MQKLDVWHLVWVLVLVVGMVLLGVTFVISLSHRENSTFANVGSIWGLFVGLIGFVVTIYTLFETQRVSRKAQQATVEAQQAMQKAASEAQEAVKNSQEQTRQVLERVRHGVREADFSTLRMWVRELRNAARLADWHRALLLAEESSALAERLRNAEGLEDGERQGLHEGADNLRLVQAHIRNTRLNTETTGLAANHARCLEVLAVVLERLGGRLYHEPTKGATP